MNNNFSNGINNDSSIQPNPTASQDNMNPGIQPNPMANSYNMNPGIQPNPMASQDNINSNGFNSQNMNNVNSELAQNYGSTQNQSVASKKSKGKITILIILISIILLGVGAFLIFKNFMNNKSNKALDSIFDPNKPIIVKNNGKYGYITSEGKIMIEPQYEDADNFYGDYAVVMVENKNADSYYDSIYQIIDKSGNVKLTSESYYGPEYYPTYDLWVVDETLYNSKMNKVLSEGILVDYLSNGYFGYVDSLKNESGIIDYKGNKVFTIPGTDIYVDICDNEYSKDDLYAEVTTYGDQEKDVVISLKTGDILFTSEDAESYYISEESDGIFLYYNHEDDENGYKNRKYLFFINNKLAYQTTELVDEVEVYNYKDQILRIDYGYDYEEIGKSQMIYYYDVKNKKMLEEAPSISSDDLEIDLIEQSYGFKEYLSSGKYGIMNGSKVIVPCEYDDIEYLNIDLFNYMKSKGKELILLEKDEKTVLYNLKNSKSITVFESDYIYEYDDSTFIKVNLYNEDGYSIKGYYIYNLLSGKSMTFEKNDEFTIGSNYIIEKKGDKSIYYNTEFKQIYEAN